MKTTDFFICSILFWSFHTVAAKPSCHERLLEWTHSSSEKGGTSKTDYFYSFESNQPPLFAGPHLKATPQLGKPGWRGRIFEVKDFKNKKEAESDSAEGWIKIHPRPNQSQELKIKNTHWIPILYKGQYTSGRMVTEKPAQLGTILKNPNPSNMQRIRRSPRTHPGVGGLGKICTNKSFLEQKEVLVVGGACSPSAYSRDLNSLWLEILPSRQQRIDLNISVDCLTVWVHSGFAKKL